MQRKFAEQVYQIDIRGFAAQLNPSTASLLLQIGRSRAKGPLGLSKTLDTARELLLRAFELDPGDTRTLVALGNVKRQSGFALGAARIYRTALLVRTKLMPPSPRTHPRTQFHEPRYPAF